MFCMFLLLGASNHSYKFVTCNARIQVDSLLFLYYWFIYFFLYNWNTLSEIKIKEHLTYYTLSPYVYLCIFSLEVE